MSRLFFPNLQSSTSKHKEIVAIFISAMTEPKFELLCSTRVCRHLLLYPTSLLTALESISLTNSQHHTPFTKSTTPISGIGNPLPKQKSTSFNQNCTPPVSKQTLITTFADVVEESSTHLKNSLRPKRHVLDLTITLLFSTTRCRHSIQLHCIHKCIQVTTDNKHTQVLAPTEQARLRLSVGVPARRM